jgi:hypothetical protein
MRWSVEKSECGERLNAARLALKKIANKRKATLSTFVMAKLHTILLSWLCDEHRAWGDL